jgi:hypothetical protein
MFSLIALHRKEGQTSTPSPASRSRSGAPATPADPAGDHGIFAEPTIDHGADQSISQRLPQFIRSAPNPSGTSLWVPDIRLRCCRGVMPIRFGFDMICVRDVAAGVSDLLSAQCLDCAPYALGDIQDCGDFGAASPGERLASAGRTPSADLGRRCPAQRADPATAQGPSSGPVRHPRHTLAMAQQLDQTTRDR